MDNISVTKNEYCIYNDTVYMLIAREAIVSMLDGYTKMLEVETKFGGVFYVPYKEYSGNINQNFKYNIYLDLKLETLLSLKYLKIIFIKIFLILTLNECIMMFI